MPPGFGRVRPAPQQLLGAVVAAALVGCACESARPSESWARDNVLSLMRGSARRGGGKWRTAGAVTVTAVPGGDAVIITCTAPAGPHTPSILLPVSRCV